MDKINIKLFKEMLAGGAKVLTIQSDYINDLNVFPVPDGDTGTNMKITSNGAVNEILENDYATFKELGAAFSRELLMNARGNSGVIFSQIFKGFTLKFPEKDELTIKDLCTAFIQAKETAYKAVTKAVEGTILTVIRVVSEKVAEKKTFKSVEELFVFVCKEAEEILAQTPEMLPVLKDVGVVDSGGYGLCRFLEGMNMVVHGTEIKDEKGNSTSREETQFKNFNPHINEEGFGYCSEIILELGAKIEPNEPAKKSFSLDHYRKELEKIGDSLVLVQDDKFVKVHIHTFSPDKLLKVSQKYGEFLKTKFENMTAQFYTNLKRQGIKMSADGLLDDTAVILTVPTQQIADIYKEDYGINYTIVTENSGNPSIHEFIAKISETKSRNIIIVTDDSNIILAVNQVIDIAKKDGITVGLVPGRDVFEALSGALEFEQKSDFKTNLRNMQKGVKNAISASISVSVKDVKYSYIEVRKGDFIGIIDKKVIVSEKDELKALQLLIDKMVKQSKNPEMLLLIFGQSVKPKLVRDIEDYVSNKYGLFVDVKNGGQKVYDFYLGIQ